MTTLDIEGVGATIAFADSGFTANLVQLTLSEKAREAIETSHLGTTDYKTSKPGKLVDAGEVQVVFDHDPSNAFLIEQDAEVITIQYPLTGSETTPGRLVFTGYATSEGGEEMMVDDIMRTNTTLKITGQPVFTAGS